MKYIEILEIDTLFDLYKLIIDGKNISITYVNQKEGTWKGDTCERYITFLHYIDNYIVQYNGVFESDTKKFIKLEIYGLVQIKGEIKNEN